MKRGTFKVALEGIGLLKRVSEVFCCKTLKSRRVGIMIQVICYCPVLASEDSAISQANLVS